jgi:hypothetical protein
MCMLLCTMVPWYGHISIPIWYHFGSTIGMVYVYVHVYSYLRIAILEYSSTGSTTTGSSCNTGTGDRQDLTKNVLGFL